jgi:hypothetical protein
MLFEDDMVRAHAIWYPQMGGYAGKAVALLPKSVEEDACFDVYVWHDGEFPFGGGKPRCLHHCSATQFIQFGQTIRRLQGGLP